MHTYIIDFTALVLALGGYWHAARYNGAKFAQQWFVAGFMTVLIRETLNQIMFKTYLFAPTFAYIGAAPFMIAVLWASVFYLAYHFALRFVDVDQPAWTTGLIALIAASFGLALEATATQLGWWWYTTKPLTIFGSVPVVAPLVWGGSAAIFYVFFWRITQTRLNEQGKFYALIAASPIIAAAQLLLVVLFNA